MTTFFVPPDPTRNRFFRDDDAVSVFKDPDSTERFSIDYSGVNAGDVSTSTWTVEHGNITTSAPTSVRSVVSILVQGSGGVLKNRVTFASTATVLIQRLTFISKKT